MYVWSSLPSNSAGFSSFKQREAILSISYDVFTLTFHENTRKLVLPNHKRFAVIPVLKQIKKLLIINLEEGAVNSEAGILVVSLAFHLHLSSFSHLEFKFSEYLLDGTRNDPKFFFVS